MSNLSTAVHQNVLNDLASSIQILLLIQIAGKKTKHFFCGFYFFSFPKSFSWLCQTSNESRCKTLIIPEVAYHSKRTKSWKERSIKSSLIWTRGIFPTLLWWKKGELLLLCLLPTAFLIRKALDIYFKTSHFLWQFTDEV